MRCDWFHGSAVAKSHRPNALLAAAPKHGFASTAHHCQSTSPSSPSQGGIPPRLGWQNACRPCLPTSPFAIWSLLWLRLHASGVTSQSQSHSYPSAFGSRFLPTTCGIWARDNAACARQIRFESQEFAAAKKNRAATLLSAPEISLAQVAWPVFAFFAPTLPSFQAQPHAAKRHQNPLPSPFVATTTFPPTPCCASSLPLCVHK